MGRISHRYHKLVKLSCISPPRIHNKSKYILLTIIYIHPLSFPSTYSGTPLIRPPTGQNKVVVLTGGRINGVGSLSMMREQFNYFDVMSTLAN